MKNALSLKGKIAVGLAAATLLSSTGVAFANSNAGTQFGVWADARIQAAQNAVGLALGLSKANALNTLQNETNTKKNTAVSEVNTAAQTESNATQAAIQAKLDEHVASLQSAFNSYSSTLGAKFDAFVALQNAATQSSFSQKVAELTGQLTTAITSAQAAGVEKVTEESLLKKSQATSDLIAKINKVKADLQALINAEQNTATTEVNAFLTSQVNGANTALNNTIETLKANAVAAFAVAGQDVEDSAILNFDKVISRLDKETPIKVDVQKLKVIDLGIIDGNRTYKVENTNEFDVVYKWKLTFTNADGVSETKSKEGSAAMGVSYFNTPVLGGVVLIQWQNENGDWVTGSIYN
ncbi:hypothetical protein [Bacillus sp. OAE603]|uniref:hypothetical protein n=1 Tax=Gottfriedia sp. OAE603 TaxID=2663872 RepID=UPI001789CF22